MHPGHRITGVEPKETLDLSANRLGAASGLAMAALILSNTAMKVLNLGGNPLRDEAVAGIGRALRNNESCALVSLDVSNTRCGVNGGKELAITVGRMQSLARLDISNNRLCGLWTDQYV